MIPKDLLEMRRLWTGYQAARVIITANTLGVFDKLTTTKRWDDLASELGTDKRATFLLLNALTALGFLKNTSKGYRNSPAANRYLVRGKPEYQGDIIGHNATMWENWSALDEVMKTGKPARRAFDMDSFILGMHNLSVYRTTALIKTIGLRGVKTALDLGGGPGTNAIALARRGVDVTLFDVPDAVKIARRLIRQEGVKVRFKKGDFFHVHIGRGYDLILISQIFHAYTEELNMEILNTCRKALNPGGRVAVQEFPIKENLTWPPPSALFAINMLVGTEGGRCYSPEEIARWLTHTGFVNIKVKQPEDTVIIVGTAGG